MTDIIPLIMPIISRLSQSFISKGLNRSETIQRVRDEFGLKGDPPLDDFDSIYVHTLVEYGVGKPAPVLNLWRHDFVRDAFKKSFSIDDTSKLLDEVDNIIQINEEKNILGEIDYNLRQEIDKFLKQFHLILDRIRNPVDIRQDHILNSLIADVGSHSQKIIAISDDIEDLQKVIKQDHFPFTETTIIPPSFLPHYFVERTILLSQLREFLNLDEQVEDKSKLPSTLALVGIGGTGKTLLARSLPNESRFQERFPGGVFWLDDGPKSPTVIESLLDWIRSLSLDPQAFGTKQSMMQAIRDRVSHHPMLVVIDDATDVELSRVILDSTPPGSFVLFTTRDNELPLRLGIKNSISIEGFNPKEARQVVNNRTNSTISDQEWNSLVKPFLERIGFHPLATSLSSAQISIGEINWATISSRLKIGEIIDSIDFTNPTIASESINLTFKNALSILNDEIRNHIQWLSILALGKSFTLPDAAMILSGIPGYEKGYKFTEGKLGLEFHKDTILQQTEFTEKSLQMLFRHGLIEKFEVNDGQPIYTFHPLIQSVALRGLRDSSDYDDAILHHARVYISLTSREAGAPAPIHPYTFTQNQFLEVLERSWSTLGEGDSLQLPSHEYAESAIILLTLGLYRYFELRGDNNELIKWSNRALQIAHDKNDSLMEHQLYTQIGRGHLNLGELSQAEFHFKHALDISSMLNNDELRVQDLVNFSIVEMSKGNSSSTIEILAECEPIALRIDDQESLGIIYGTLSMAHLHEGNPDRALEYEELALKIAVDSGNLLAEGSRIGNMAAILQHRGLRDLRKAVQLFHRSRFISIQTGNLQSQANHLMNLAQLYYSTARLKMAKVCLDESINILIQINSPRLKIAEQLQSEFLDNDRDPQDALFQGEIFEYAEMAIRGDPVSRARLETYISVVLEESDKLPDLADMLSRLSMILDGEREPAVIFKGNKNPPPQLMILLHNAIQPGTGTFLFSIGFPVVQSIHGRPGAQTILSQLQSMLEVDCPFPSEKSGLEYLVNEALKGEKNPTNLVSRIKNRFIRDTLKSMLSSGPPEFNYPDYS